MDFDRYSDRYDEYLRRETAFFSSDDAYFARYKVRIARAIGGPARRILEFGCGTGRNIAHLRQCFPDAEVNGSDVSGRSLEVARAENPGVHFWLEGTPGEERSGFDLVFVAGVFHHVPPTERVEVARRIRSRLVPGGRAIVFEHNPYNPVTRRIVSNCPYDADAVLLRPRELRGILEDAGFAVRGQGYALFFPPALATLGRLEAYLGWLPLGGQYWMHAASG